MNINNELTKVLDDDHSIEIGGASWNPNETSIRRRYNNPESGRFSPHGSSELPLYALEDLIRVAAENDILEVSSCVAMIEHLAGTVRRLMSQEDQA